MKTFLIDWGETSLGGRFALIQAATLRDAVIGTDDIGSPFRITELVIPKMDECGVRYVEISQPTNPCAGPNIVDVGKWENGFHHCFF